jgi:acyl-CoA synthetase (AMP-forming)/AMP-acid ligase II
MAAQGLRVFDEAVASLTAPGQPFALHEVEVGGVTYRCYREQPDNLAGWYAGMPGRGEREFVVYRDERYSYAEAHSQACAFGAALVEQFGVARGDRVAIVMRNNPQWLLAYMAITSIGAVVVPTNAWWTTEELDYGLRDSGSRVVIVDPERAERLAPIAGELGVAVIAVGDCAASGLDTTDFAALLASFAGSAMPEVEVLPDDDASIMYTSGSTGHPKGAVSSHRSVLAALYSMLLMGNATKLAAPPPVDDSAPRYKPCALLTVPLFHATGSHSLFLLSLPIGRKIVIMHKWDAEEAMRLIEAERVTNFNGVPTMSAELQAAARDGRYDLSSLREIYSGGAARPPDQVKKIVGTFRRSSPGSGYGLTETNTLGAVNSGAFYIANPRSTGRVIPAVTDLRIVDQQGAELPAGEAGEVCIHSPANVRGYWNKPEATAEAFVDGWFHSGDVGYLDDDGFLYIVDRIKEIIIRGGENISCIEVEAAIYQHAAVEEAAVFGLPDERLGEIVGAAVVVREGATLTEAGLQSYLGDHLAAFKIPQHVWIRRETLPRIATGKIFKRQLKADYAAELAAGRRT